MVHRSPHEISVQTRNRAGEAVRRTRLHPLHRFRKPVPRTVGRGVVGVTTDSMQTSAVLGNRASSLTLAAVTGAVRRMNISSMGSTASRGRTGHLAPAATTGTVNAMINQVTNATIVENLTQPLTPGMVTEVTRVVVTLSTSARIPEGARTPFMEENTKKSHITVISIILKHSH